MGRTVVRFPYYCSFDDAKRIIGNILVSRNYKLINYKNDEIVWRNGVGLMTAMKYIRVDIAQNEIILSSWVCMGIDSATAGEMELKGFFGAIPKNQVKSVINEISMQFQGKAII